MSLSRYTTKELLEEVARRTNQYAPRCQCGPLRKEIVHEQQSFYPRFGCLTCDTWDDIPRLNGAPA